MAKRMERKVKRRELEPDPESREMTPGAPAVGICVGALEVVEIVPGLLVVEGLVGDAGISLEEAVGPDPEELEPTLLLVATEDVALASEDDGALDPGVLDPGALDPGALDPVEDVADASELDAVDEVLVVGSGLALVSVAGGEPGTVDCSGVLDTPPSGGFEGTKIGLCILQ